MKYSPCTRAQHESGHGIGWDLQVWPVSCLFILAGPFYRILMVFVISSKTTSINIFLR
ncbi:MAG: hypothetical protein WCI89_04050 [bacterium]